MRNIVIGIGGASRSGKTTLAAGLQAHYEQKLSVVVLHQDDFIRPLEEIPKVRDEVDWEHPSSLDFEGLIATIQSARRNHHLTIVEGFLVYSKEALYRLFDIKLFVEIDKRTFFTRRRQDRRYGPDAKWYIAHTWESFLKYGQVPDKIRDEVIFVGQENVSGEVIDSVDEKLSK